MHILTSLSQVSPASDLSKLLKYCFELSSYHYHLFILPFSECYIEKFSPRYIFRAI